jgi:hypothetical protein
VNIWPISPFLPLSLSPPLPFSPSPPHPLTPSPSHPLTLSPPLSVTPSLHLSFAFRSPLDAINNYILYTWNLFRISYFSSYPIVRKSKLLHFSRIVNIPSIKDHFAFHKLFHYPVIKQSEFRPFSNYNQCIRIN